MVERAKLEIIDNNENEIEDFKDRNDSCGSTVFFITKKQLQELINGKIVAMSDGEYCNFISLKDGDE